MFYYEQNINEIQFIKASKVEFRLSGFLHVFDTRVVQREHWSLIYKSAVYCMAAIILCK